MRGARFHLWWQKIREILAIVAIIGGYLFHWSWTGISTKILWDWLQLLVIPVFVGLGVAWFTAKLNEQQSRTEHKITSDNQQQVALQAYIYKIEVAEAGYLPLHSHLLQGTASHVQ